MKTMIKISLFFTLALGLISCTKDKNEPILPQEEGISFKYERINFNPETVIKSYDEGNVVLIGADENTKYKVSIIVQEKMREGHYNFANIFNVSMKFEENPYATYFPVAGNFDLLQMDRENGHLVAKFDCILKNNATGKIREITEGVINIQYK